MKISIGIPNKNYKNNFNSKVDYRFICIPYVAVREYFYNSQENIYFLFLSLLQLSTSKYIGLLRSYWSPTGPYSTFVPLILCFFLELFTIFLKWIFLKKN